MVIFNSECNIDIAVICLFESKLCSAFEFYVSDICIWSFFLESFYWWHVYILDLSFSKIVVLDYNLIGNLD